MLAIASCTPAWRPDEPALGATAGAAGGLWTSRVATFPVPDSSGLGVICEGPITRPSCPPAWRTELQRASPFARTVACPSTFAHLRPGTPAHWESARAAAGGPCPD